MAPILRCMKYVQKGLRTKPLVFSGPHPNHSFRAIVAFVRQSDFFPATHIPIPSRLFSSSIGTAMAKTLESQESNPPTTLIRPATLADTKSIVDLGVHVFSVTFGHSVEPHELQAFLDEAYSVEAVTKDLNDPNKDTILATDPAGDILGFAMLTRGSVEPCVADFEGTVELQRIYTYPKAHGTGAGKLLADKLEDMAREQGFKHIWLGVWEENFRAKKAYGKWGYKPVGNHDFVVGTVAQRDDIMLKKL